jgi:ABC-type transporter Mla MlaB component
MLMINKVETPDVITLKLEGRLVGPWVKELAFLWNSAVGLEQKSIRVDLSAVTYVDATGVELLTLILQGGARITATGSLNQLLVEEISRAARHQEAIAGDLRPPTEIRSLGEFGGCEAGCAAGDP